MTLLNRMPTTRYFISLFAVVSALFFVFSGVIYRNYQQAQTLNQWAFYNYEVARQSRKILFDLVGMETGVRGYLLTGQKRFLRPYISSKKAVNQEAAELRDYTQNDPSTQGDIDVWLKSIETFSQTLERQVGSYGNSLWRGTTAEQMEEQKQQMDRLRLMLEEFIKKRIGNLNQRLVQSKDAQANFKYVLAIGTVLAVGGMLFATLMILALLKRSQRAEKAAREQEERFLTVMAGVNDGVYDLNTINDDIYYSSSYKSMLGYAEDEFANTLAMSWDIMHPDDAAKAKAAIDKFMRGDVPLYSNSFRMMHKQGHWVWILSRGVAIRDEQGRIIRLIGTHTDITEQKKREEELALVNSEMETFTFITSHDLRAPLVNLRGFASELTHALKRALPIIKKSLDHYAPDDRKVLEETLEQDIPESVKFIEQAVTRMDALTTAVLDLSRIGKREYRVEKVDMNSVIRRCLDALAYEISQKKITVTVDDLPTLFSDTLAVEQVFSNILDNAVKYLSPVRPGSIHIGAQISFNEVAFRVRDNGRGIANEDNEKVFQIFRRARNSQDVRGMGMGMAFVQATLRRLRGSIWFTSEVDVGTTFYIQLPIKPVLKGI